jgi:hypothetical protein
VLAVRTEEEILDEALLPAPMDPELLARCRALGVRLPQRYRDTPSEQDTPRDDPAPQPKQRRRSAVKTKKEIRLETLLDRRETVARCTRSSSRRSAFGRQEPVGGAARARCSVYRDEEVQLDDEIALLNDDIERDRKAAETSKAIRRTLAGAVDGVEVDGDGIVYRDFYTYARDVVLTRQSQGFAKIAAQFGRDEVEAAHERLGLLMRTPANTLSSNVAGLTPAQHIDQIFQVINKKRPLVDSALRTTLERGQLTYPKVAQRPLVAVQASEKTEAGNQSMHVDMETATASTYLGGGDLSWQALNWSSPDALQLWFDLAAADYALKTETDAGDVVTDAAYTYRIGSLLTSTPTFAQFLTAVGAGASAVYTNSGRQADTLYMAEDRFWYMFGLSSDQFAQFAAVGTDGIGPLKIVRARGFGAGEVVVGDSSGLLVAETAGAPVELRAVEPAIGGLEVGIIGAFEAVVVDDGAFSLITTAS